MNQILNFGKNQGTKGTGIKPVITFFTVIIILFALILVAEGAYNMFFNKEQNSGVSAMPTISAIQDGSSVVITAEYRTGIDKVMYYWNNGEEAIIQARGNSKIQEKIPLPIGTNKLNLSVIDTKGKMTRYSPKEFVFNSDIDSNKPDIEIVKGTNTGTIKMVITDDKALKTVTYQWSEDDIITPEIQEGATSFELELAAKEGERALTITAVDTSDNEESITKTIKGSKKPEISVVKDGQYLIITATDEDKIGKLEYNFNGATKTLENINENTYEIKLELVSGDNYVIVTAYDVDGLTAQYKGKCSY